ncbi:MAG: DUF2190 family protein [Lachnospiraceae bacterium]
MSKATYFQRGETLDFANDTTDVIAANTIMPYGTRLGVIGTDIMPGELGSIAVTGVFEMPKDSAAIEAGVTVYYDTAASKITATSKPVVAGYAAQAAAAGDDTVLVKLLG